MIEGRENSLPSVHFLLWLPHSLYIDNKLKSIVRHAFCSPTLTPRHFQFFFIFLSLSLSLSLPLALVEKCFTSLTMMRMRFKSASMQSQATFTTVNQPSAESRRDGMFWNNVCLRVGSMNFFCGWSLAAESSTGHVTADCEPEFVSKLNEELRRSSGGLSRTLSNGVHRARPDGNVLRNRPTTEKGARFDRLISLEGRFLS